MFSARLHRSHSLKHCLNLSLLLLLRRNGRPLQPTNVAAVRRYTNNMKTPELIYFPRILRWVKTKIGFKVLQSTWDPEFSEGAFIYGSTCAICRITEAIGAGDRHDELQELVTPALRHKLQADIELRLSELQRRIIVLTPPDIKLLIPLEVRLMQADSRRKLCAVGLRSLAVKWQQLDGTVRLAIVALHTEFIRDYSEHVAHASEWTVHVFDILECGVAGEVQQ